MITMDSEVRLQGQTLVQTAGEIYLKTKWHYTKKIKVWIKYYVQIFNTTKRAFLIIQYVNFRIVL